MISEAEKQRRLRAVKSSEASLAIEGQELDAHVQELNRRYISGELSFDEFSMAIDRHVQALAAAMRTESLAIPA